VRLDIPRAPISIGQVRITAFKPLIRLRMPEATPLVALVTPTGSKTVLFRR
jgi:hypothetical protein